MPLNEKLLEEVDDDRLLGIPLELRNSDALNREQTAKKAVLPERRVKTDKSVHFQNFSTDSVVAR